MEVSLLGTHCLPTDNPILPRKWQTGYLKGWIKSIPVHADSVSFQCINSLSPHYQAYHSLDLEIVSYNFETGNFGETGVVVKNFSAQLSKTITLPVYDANRNTIFYYGKLKNTETGEYLIQPGFGSEIFYTDFASTPGIFYIAIFTDNAGDVEMRQVIL